MFEIGVNASAFCNMPSVNLLFCCQKCRVSRCIVDGIVLGICQLLLKVEKREKNDRKKSVVELVRVRQR